MCKGGMHEAYKDAKKEMIASLVSLMKKERVVTENLNFGETPEFLKEMKEAYDL